jgi:flagellar FliL protein
MAKKEDIKEDDDAEEGIEGEGEEGEGGEGKKSSKLKLILFILIPIVLIGGGAAAAYFTGALNSVLGVEAPADGELSEGGGETAEHGEVKIGKKAGGHGAEESGDVTLEAAFVAIPPMLVNLNTEDGTPRFLRLSIQLELANSADHDSVIAVLPRVIDQFQTYLRELRVRDLRGSAGIYRLQVELLWRVNQAVEPIEIKDVLFQEILIQ